MGGFYNSMNFIEDIKSVDEKIHQIMEESFGELIKSISKSTFPSTGKALITLTLKSNFIKNAIFDLCENDDLYSVSILFRSLIEHYLRQQYLFMRYAQEKNDSIGIDYYKYCNMGEDLGYIKSIKYIHKMFDDKNDFDIWGSYCSVKPEFKNLTKIERKSKVDQFNYKNIISFIWNFSKNEEVSNFLQNIILNYSELSSFVHGGPYGENMMFSNGDKKKRNKKLKNMAELSFTMAKQIKQFTYLFAYQLDTKYGSFYNRLLKSELPKVLK